MPRVTDIQVQKKRKDRVSIYLDGDFWTGMSQACFLELGFERDQVLSNDEVEQAEARVVTDSALTYALNRLNYGLLSEAKLKEKLLEREYSEAIADSVVARCRDLALVNDAYLAELVASGMRERGMGRRRASEKMRDKGLPSDLAEEALDEAFPASEDLDLARRSLQLKFGKDPLDRPDQRRALGLLTRRGFSPGIAQTVITEQSLSEEEESELHGPEEARELVARKYGAGLDRDQKRKAYGFLARRGFTSSVINRALTGVEE